ncbi:phosphoglucosamine mutase [[Haemophilus] ducreyi]|uniref:phosphoglucosamine mutase n=1 Tax=Haemophilus ducreyi TaxID=730 RepID=UPI000654FFEC|nr:phosphoglucosamine mutase [[Haemophilus] ducreyi]AKO36108.1 phosphoglucosamine mutase [[Haemophilus] ducreyi]AKO37561.1 phosphoglucosamine mutase [[Haemophilus] ducreyi]AKO40609.1 phosphoglucosamine mutase [[Haemophilus] ducreyi]AKO42060.1 phosphoglucosamine mutase [[Haemophilus] ducreyi]
MAERKYFGTDGVRGKVGQFPITPDFALKLGWAAGKILATQGTKQVLIGKDTRISGYMLESALEAGLAAAGLSAAFVGPMPTPAVAYLTRTFRAEAGIVISASHNPYYDNGIKFFSANGEKLPDEVEEAIEALLDQPMDYVESDQLGKAIRINDAAGRYIEFCKGTFPADASLKGYKIVVDCAHGATYHIAPNVMRELGAEVIEIGTHPNGLNINDKCGATDISALQQAVLTSKADLGVAYDGDGDRIIMVDHLGNKVDGDQILFIIAREALRSGKLKGGVVGTLMSNMGLEIALKHLAIPFTRANVGDRYVLEQLKEKNWKLGGENSGHIIVLDKNTTGDSIIASLEVLAAMEAHKMSLNDLTHAVPLFPQVLLNVRFDGGNNPLENAAVKALAKDIETRLVGKGRILLRKSGTEPLIRVMVECEDAVLAQQYAEEIVSAIQNH